MKAMSGRKKKERPREVTLVATEWQERDKEAEGKKKEIETNEKKGCDRLKGEKERGKKIVCGHT